jgi:hypothetical protein
MRILTTALVASLLAFAAKGSETEKAGPFGIWKGEADSEVQIESEIDHFLYKLKTVPRPHPSFDVYAVVLTPATGVCKVIAVSPVIDNDAFGNSTRSAFATVEEQLSEVYGSGKMYDFLHAGSIWEDEKYWAMSFAQNERSYAKIWSEESKASLKDDITDVVLEVISAGHNALQIRLHYEFYNMEDCKKAMKEEGKGAL